MDEKRRGFRHPLSLPVLLESGRGRLRDMSGNGVYFETSSEIELGPIRFTIGMDVISEDVELMSCEGQVVRIEEIDEEPPHRGVAARIDHIEF